MSAKLAFEQREDLVGLLQTRTDTGTDTVELHWGALLASAAAGCHTRLASRTCSSAMANSALLCTLAYMELPLQVRKACMACFEWLPPAHCRSEPLVLAGCYYAASSNMQFEEFLTRHGLLGSTCFLPGICLPKYKGWAQPADLECMQLTRSRIAVTQKGKEPSRAGWQKAAHL